jgi:type I restriction enzyme M protein
MLEIQIKEKENEIYSRLRDKWLKNSPEEEVRQKYICQLVNHYGYSLDQMEEEVSVTNSQRGTGRARADIIIYKSKADLQSRKKAFIVVECKSDKVKIHSEDYYQGANYAKMKGASFIVTHNTFETCFFLTPDVYPEKLEEIIDIPKFEDIDNEKKLKELEEKTKVFTREEFTKLLLTCHNVIRNNDKLSPEAAFDEISKILFIKIRYEREGGKRLFSLSAFNEEKNLFNNTIKPYLQGEDKTIQFYQFKFRETKQVFEKDELFEPNEQINIREGSFEKIVELLEKYDLSNTSDDIKGIAFESFLGRTFRGELGQFFTPRTMVDFMVEILDPQEGQTVCDPCCGSGGFLIKAFEYIRTKVEIDITTQKEAIKAKYFDDNYESMDNDKKKVIDDEVEAKFKELNKQLDNQITGSRLWNLSHNSIYGSDANPRMARVSKMNMIMHGDGHGGVHHNDGLINVNEIFENRFDIILTNPPFGARVDKSHKMTQSDNKYIGKEAEFVAKYGAEGQNAINQIQNNIGESLLKQYETGMMSTLTEVLFMERYLKLLKKGGKMAVVLPEGFLNNPNLQKVREYFEARAKIILVVSIPQDVFIASGATVKPSLIFLQKFTESEDIEYNQIVDEITQSINVKYQDQVKELTKQVTNSKGDLKKALTTELKNLKAKIEDEIKKTVKLKFDYQIPIVEVEKAGITSTGQKCENQLEDVVKEWKEYQKSKIK